MYIKQKNKHSLSGNARSLNGFVLGAIFCLIASCLPAHGHSIQRCRRTVVDSTGAAIVGATINLTNEELGVKKTVASNDTGYFRIDSIAAGDIGSKSLRLRFKSWVEQETGASSRSNSNCCTEAGGRRGEETVSVTATQASLDLTSASTTAVIPIQTVQQIPLVGQNVYSLAALAPGVTGPGMTSGDNFNIQYGIEIKRCSQRQESNSFMIDGAFVDTPSLGGRGVHFAESETVQSVQVSTNEFDASKGRTAGADVQVYTNSGTNEIPRLGVTSTSSTRH